MEFDYPKDLMPLRDPKLEMEIEKGYEEDRKRKKRNNLIKLLAILIVLIIIVLASLVMVVPLQFSSFEYAMLPMVILQFLSAHSVALLVFSP